MTALLQQLHIDHRNAARLLNILDWQASNLRIGGDRDYGLMMDIMTYMTQYPDQYHHPKEDLLFARLLARDTGSRNRVEKLSREHQVIAQDSLALLGLLRSAEHDDDGRRAELIELTERYASRLRAHMNEEEREVFPRAKAALWPEDWALIDAQMATRADPLFGSFVADQYRKRYRQIMRLADKP